MHSLRLSKASLQSIRGLAVKIRATHYLFERVNKLVLETIESTAKETTELVFPMKIEVPRSFLLKNSRLAQLTLQAVLISYPDSLECSVSADRGRSGHLVDWHLFIEDNRDGFLISAGPVSTLVKALFQGNVHVALGLNRFCIVTYEEPSILLTSSLQAGRLVV